MKLAIAGKGGAGKTTIAALLINLLRGDGYAVLAIDADPDANLAASLDFPHPEDIVPLIEMKTLIEERTGAVVDTIGTYFNLNPYVADIPDKYTVSHNGIKLMVMGGFRSNAKGCFCAENAFLKALLSHLLLKRDEVIVVDMEAGIEHLSRGTAAAVDLLIVVADPGRQSIATAHRIEELAKSAGIRRVGVIGNRIRSAEDEELLTAALAPMEMIGVISESARVREADIKGKSLLDSDKKVTEEIKRIKSVIVEQLRDKC